MISISPIYEIIITKLFRFVYSFLFLLMLFPNSMAFVAGILLGISLSEAIYSYIRGKLLTIIFLLFISILVVMSFIPYIGVIFTVIGFLITLVRFILTGRQHIISMNYPKKKQHSSKVYDVKYKEKE